MKDNLHIIFGEEHYNPLGIIRSLGESGIKPVAIIIRSKKKIASRSRYIGKLHLVNDIEEGYQILIKEYGDEINKPFLYTSDDTITAFLDNHYTELKNKFHFFNAGQEGRLNYYMDKFNLINLADKCGLKVAKTWVVKKGEIPKDIEFPIITKACNSKISGWKNEVHICNDRNELQQAYKEIKGSEIILQKYIVKKNEIAVSGISVNKGEKVLYTMEINFKYLLEDQYSFYMTVNNFKGYDMIDNMNLLFKKIGFEGIFEIEFLLGEDEEIYFLEINFRPTAWNYASTVAGMSLPVIWAKSTLNNNCLINSYREYIGFDAISEFNDFRIRVKTNKIGIFKWLKQLFLSKCKYVYNRKDIKPFLSVIKSYIIK